MRLLKPIAPQHSHHLYQESALKSRYCLCPQHNGVAFSDDHRAPRGSRHFWKGVVWRPERCFSLQQSEVMLAIFHHKHFNVPLFLREEARRFRRGHVQVGNEAVFVDPRRAHWDLHRLWKEAFSRLRHALVWAPNLRCSRAR